MTLPAGVTDADLLRSADAWEAAGCPGREGPFGLYDYTSYGASEPYRVRDFREPGVAEYGSVVFRSDDRSAAFVEYNRLTGIHCASAALTAALAGRVVVPAWSDGNPPVKRGGMNEFALAVYRQHSGKVYSFAASYLNAYPLTYDYECPKGSGCEGKGCDDGCPTTGWFVQTGEDGDATTFHDLSLKEGDKIMGWTEIPRWSAAVTPGLDGTP